MRRSNQKQRLYGWFQEWADIEAQATVLRWYEPLVVPGLLQTEDYARAILSARPDGNLTDLDEQVAARLARQTILDRTGAPQRWCILDEGVLHRPIGGPKVMRGQLYRLAEVAEHPAVLVSQIQAGGVGLNIQAASVVILTEPQWKPTIEDQAIARSHRMGQVRSVDVHRLLAEDTVDQRMLEILATKAVLFDEYGRRSELKDHSPDAVDVSDLKAADEVGSQVEAERRIIELERKRLRLEAERGPARPY